MPNGIEQCVRCGKSLGSFVQDDMFSPQKLCITCLTKDRVKMILGALPDEDDPEWERLNAFEQSFLPSVQQQFDRKGALSEKQIEVVERIWEKVNR